MTDYNKLVGARIKKRRKELGLTQKALGEMVDCAEITIRQYESGRSTPKADTRVKLANALNASYSDLFDPTEPESFETGEDFNAAWEALTKELREAGGTSIETQHHTGGTVTNVLHHDRPEIDLSELTVAEIHELQNYRNYLLFKRDQRPPNN